MTGGNGSSPDEDVFSFQYVYNRVIQKELVRHLNQLFFVRKS